MWEINGLWVVLPLETKLVLGALVILIVGSRTVLFALVLGMSLIVAWNLAMVIGG